jgi:hypothetical protein
MLKSIAWRGDDFLRESHRLYLPEAETVQACREEAYTGKKNFFHVIFVMRAVCSVSRAFPVVRRAPSR